MKTPVKKISFVISLFILVAFVPFTAFGDTILSFEPVAPVTVGSSFDVFVEIPTAYPVTDLYSFSFDIAFDPSVLSVLSVTEPSGSLLQGGGNFFGGLSDTPGSITFIYNLLPGSVPGVTGSGQLVDLGFQAVSKGFSNLALSNVLLINSQVPDETYSNIYIPFTTSDITIDVNSAPIPEPATLLLMGLGSALMGGGIKRLRRRFGKKEILA